VLKQRPHIPALDGLRGMAVLIVFLFHYGGGTHSSLLPMRIFGYINKGGWAGVTLFFVLSGFLITGILWDSFGEEHWWRNFYIRRVLRIFPLYYGSIALVIFAAALKGTLYPALRLIWIPVFFLQNMPHLNALVDIIPSPLGLFHFWSLAVEEQFYLLWPVVLFLQKTRDRARTLCLGIFLFACLFRLLIWHFAPNPNQFSQFLFSRSGELAAGGWLALAYRGPEWARVKAIAPFAALAGLAGFLASGVLNGTFECIGYWQSVTGLPCITVFAAALLVLAMEPGIVQRCAEAAWLRWLGGISYGVYVFHLLFLAVYNWIEQRIFGSRSALITNVAVLIIAAVGSVCSAWLSFRFFETPFLRLKNRLSARSPEKASEITI
jgi:peptidoglycan/LPS O-acetylase OafA/YrhL